jgi:hypothetical protein
MTELLKCVRTNLVSNFKVKKTLLTKTAKIV